MFYHRAVPHIPPTEFLHLYGSVTVPSDTEKFIEMTKSKHGKGFYIVDLSEDVPESDDYVLGDFNIFSGPHESYDIFDYFSHLRKNDKEKNIYRILFYQYDDLPKNCRMCSCQALTEHYACPRCKTCGICNKEYDECTCPCCVDCGILDIDWERFCDGKAVCCSQKS